MCFFFFFQAEDGIRDKLVTGVQTCALPICPVRATIDCFPNAARDRAEIIRVRFAGHAFDRQRAATAERTDLPPLHSLEQFFVNGSRRRWRSSACRRGSWTNCKDD